jgi:hypothetical protein
MRVPSAHLVDVEQLKAGSKLCGLAFASSRFTLCVFAGND